MTVAVFNDRFSLNVGDGLLAVCLERELGHLLPTESVQTIDIDGKAHFPSPDRTIDKSASTLRQAIIASLPQSFKREIIGAKVNWRLRREIRKVGQPRVFVIGGGHLINGTGSYFPLRLRALARIARSRGVPMFVHSVGVTDPATWEPAIARSLTETFDSNPDLLFVSVRDTLSAQYWRRAFPRSVPPEICLDPGLLTRKTFGAAPARRGAAIRIGVGVISRRVAQRLATGPNAIHSTRRFYLELCRSLVRRGSQPCLFTNGDPEDHAEMEQVFQAAQGDGELRPIVSAGDRPTDERSLVDTLARFDGLVAHRMHATIAAYSLGIPTVGLAWDRKLESFFRLVKRERYFIADPKAAPDIVAERMEEAVHSGIAECERREVVRAAEGGVRTLARHVGCAEVIR